MQTINKSEQFILNVLGCYKGTLNYIEKIQNDFGIALEQADLREVFTHCHELSKVGNAIITTLFEKVIDKAIAAYPTMDEEYIRDNFDYDVQDCYIHLYYQGDEVENWEDVVIELDMYGRK